MRLTEYRAKEIFEKTGIKTPRGQVASTPEEARAISEKLGVPVVIKAQVLVGGRGLAGGIKFADNPAEAQRIAGDVLGGILKKLNVEKVLVEEKIPIEREYYASVTLDYESKYPVVIVSSMGGVDIEATASEHPEAIVKELVDSPLGLRDFQVRRIAKRVGLRGSEMRHFAGIIGSLYRILHDYDANLVEINPLALTTDKQFLAVDAKIILDESASFRHKMLYLKLEADKKMPTEGTKLRKALAEKAEISTYLELEGNIAVIADGAGTGMLTFDLVKDYNGRIETYCELGGKANPALIEEAMKIVLSNDKVHVLLINLIGGLNKMDEMAEGITSYVSKYKPVVAKIVVRMSGTLEQKGREILKSQGITAFDNIYEAIERTVELARGN